MQKVWDIEAGELVEEASHERLDHAELMLGILPEDNTVRNDLEVMVEAARAELNKPPANYFGNCRITHYCSCSQCCGKWGNATASGVPPTTGRTVANGSLPFGTRVLINGQEYVVEDRGVGSDQFDIYVGSHQEALDRGLYYTEVYVIG